MLNFDAMQAGVSQAQHTQREILPSVFQSHAMDSSLNLHHLSECDWIAGSSRQLTSGSCGRHKSFKVHPRNMKPTILPPSPRGRGITHAEGRLFLQPTQNRFSLMASFCNKDLVGKKFTFFHPRSSGLDWTTSREQLSEAKLNLEVSEAGRRMGISSILQVVLQENN